ncbi:MAG: RluA family pseudouridine synthase [Anaerolineaceae bacterium]|nr:RluA family pseudouridine synthase [Anaerolineaceae bacterium]MBN2676718.1 RluA family pseudouridine synthase [Anaerolineaceae bacterium]
MSDEKWQFTFEGGDSDRLDKFLVVCIPEYSRSRLQGLIHDGMVTIDGIIPEKAGVVLNKGQVVSIRIPPAELSNLQPEAIPLVVIFENEDLMVVNKPAGMVVHPGAGHASHTLVNAALGHAPDMAGISGELRPGVVHRLDKDTSGVILVAKNDKAHQYLQDQFKSRKVKKSYLALVDGHPPTPSGRIDAPIGRDTSNRKRMAVVSPSKGRQAVTEYHSREVFAEHELIEAHPITGRTHQVRLHLAFLGCPVAGDLVYGKRHASLGLKRTFLHAWRLQIKLPGQKTNSDFEAPLPEELENILLRLRA